MPSVDLNADLGEGFEFDAELMTLVTSCNIACGGHAGDDASMLATVQLAIENNVAIGAHPSYPDVAGFGRQSKFSTDEVLKKSLINQLDRITRIAREQGAEVKHVKPHGALYNDAANSRELADTVVAALRAAGADVALVGPAASQLELAANEQKIPFVAEAFVDRAYRPDGKLVARTEPNAVHSDMNTITTQALKLATAGVVTAENGALLNVRADTLCIHGDTPNAAQIARAVRDVLGTSGVIVRAAN